MSEQSTPDSVFLLLLQRRQPIVLMLPNVNVAYPDTKEYWDVFSFAVNLARAGGYVQIRILEAFDGEMEIGAGIEQAECMGKFVRRITAGFTLFDESLVYHIRADSEKFTGWVINVFQAHAGELEKTIQENLREFARQENEKRKRACRPGKK